MSLVFAHTVFPLVGTFTAINQLMLPRSSDVYSTDLKSRQPDGIEEV